MRNGAVLLRRGAYVEESQHRRQIGLAGSGKVPVREGLFCISACIRTAVAAQHLRRIVVRIKAHAQQMRLLVKLRIIRERLVDLRKIATHARAEICEWAARVDKGHQQHLAAKLRKVDLPAALVQQMKVRNLITGLNRMIEEARLVVRFGLRDDDDFIQQIGIVCGNQRRGNAVARMQLRNDGRVLQLIRHRHRFHETGNRRRIQNDLSMRRIDADDFATHRIMLHMSVGGRLDCFWTCPPAATAWNDTNSRSKKAQGEKRTGHSSVYTFNVLPLFDSQLHPKLMDIVLDALAEGGVIVTANARAGRVIRLNHAERQRANGLAMWATPAIFDWDTWLNHLWQEQALTNPDAPLLLTPFQEHALWIRVQQKAAELVVSLDALASLAQSAYQSLSDYELQREKNAAWFEPDAEQFRQWSKAFDQLCSERNWASRSNLEALLSRIDNLNLPKRVLLAGFDRFTPAQQDLLEHFRKSGAVVEEAVLPPSEAMPTLLAAVDARDELLTCAEWCRHKLEHNPGTRIGVIAPDVRSIRSEADRVFRSVLMPQSLDLANASAPMPFEFSLGVPLSTIPVVRAALLLLGWINTPLPEEDVSWILLSGFFQADASEALDLAQLDFKRRDFGALSPETSLKKFADRHASKPFARRMKRVLKAADESQAGRKEQTYVYWSDLTEKLLGFAQWPGHRPPDSVQFQAQQRWVRLLDAISLLDFAGGKVAFSAFLQTLETHAAETTFSAESHYAPIQILGALESSGQTFDAIWFLGADDALWPQAGRPHPLLPIALQRKAKMPHCEAAVDTELAITVTRRIAGSAAECVYSYARQNKEGELQPSPILESAFPDGMHSISSVEFRQQMGLPEPAKIKPQIESAVVRSQIAPWPSDRIAGGADVLRDQAACPFRAFAVRRFVARPLDCTEWGLDAAQRGSLLHSILENIWSPETAEEFRIASLDDLHCVIVDGRLDEVLRYHIGNEFEDLVRQHAADVWMQAYFESEQHRLLVRLGDWMRYEAGRQPFTVDKVEEKLKDVSVGPLKLNLRADRIDKLPDNSHLLIDYKTGKASASAWKGERPDEPQLPLYAVYGNVEHVSGLLFAQIRAGDTEFAGRAANAQQTVMADLTANSSLVNQPLDDDMHDAWRQALLQLAEEFLEGEASVDPKHGKETCTYCPLPGLCRVAETDRSIEPDDVEGEDA